MTGNDATSKSATPSASRPASWRERLFAHRFGSLVVFGLVFLVLSLVLRVALLVREASQADMGIAALVRTFATGLLFDVATLSCLTGIASIFYVLMPDKAFRGPVHRFAAMAVLFVAIFIMLFDFAAEWIFWGEFGARFNFIAVDYLIYTNELFGNIFQSYNVPLIMGVLAAIATGIFLLVRRPAAMAFAAPSRFSRRLAAGVMLIAVPAAFLALLSDSASQIGDYRVNNELAKNGLFSFVAAFRNNIIDYKQFYASIDDREAFARVRKQLAAPGAGFVSEEPTDLRRDIAAPGPEKHLNVVLFVVESLSAKFFIEFGETKNLTPYMDKLAGQSLFFTNLYATGTRTTRGLEAITLSLPPTPGQSLVKRPDNGGLFNIGKIFASRGYDTTFAYGGFGYFDNMNAYFAGNGFKIVDRRDMAKNEITFTNAWGVCDEDLFNRVLKESDGSHAAGKPFFTLIMTTSNHRPYTFPKGKIDMPQGERNSVVRYTDYAIGDFLEKARTKPWFDNTVFVIVADHCASSAGKTDVQASEYHIPLFIYSPKNVKPQRVDKLASQIDIAPTLLGLLNFSYRSKFFGRDVLAEGPGRALIGNYQKIGLLEDGTFTLLLPKMGAEAFHVDGNAQSAVPVSKDKVADTVSYYQTADYAISHNLQKAE